jgi:hypothetical protein
MKRYLFGVIGLALLGGSPLWAQTPMAGHPVVIMEPSGGSCCSSGSCGGCCQLEHYCKTKDNVVYSCGSEPLCVVSPKGLFGHGCCGCDHYTRRYLIKKIQPCQRDALRCVATEMPACQHGQCCLGSDGGSMGRSALWPAPPPAMPSGPPAMPVAPTGRQMMPNNPYQLAR